MCIQNARRRAVPLPTDACGACEQRVVVLSAAEVHDTDYNIVHESRRRARPARDWYGHSATGCTLR